MATWKIYWVEKVVGNGIDDWFVVARDAPSAKRFFEKEELIAPGDAFAEKMSELPDEYEAEAIARSRPEAEPHPWPGWADTVDLRAAGAEVRESDGVRHVIIKGRSFFPVTIEEVVEACLSNPSIH